MKDDDTKNWGRVWEPGDDEQDEAKRDGNVQEHPRKQAGKFYSITPPQATISRPVENFDPKTFMDRGIPKLCEETTPEHITFARAMFCGNVVDEEWMHEWLAPKIARIKDELEIFIGQAMNEPDGPWRLFLIRRTTCGSRVEEE